MSRHRIKRPSVVAATGMRFARLSIVSRSSIRGGSGSTQDYDSDSETETSTPKKKCKSKLAKLTVKEFGKKGLPLAMKVSIK